MGKSSYDLEWDQLIMKGIAFIAGIFIIILLISMYKQSQIQTQVLLEVEYCAQMKTDTIFTTITGTANTIYIENNNKHLAVPELRSFNGHVIALNICSFKILSKTEIRQ